MELKEMFPKSSSFNLIINGEPVEIKLRKVSLRDHLWCSQTFGAEISQALEDNSEDMNQICRIVYNQIVPEDKKYFKAVTNEEPDEEGNLKKVIYGGYTLLSHYIDSIDTYQQVMEAYKEALIAGMPIANQKKK